MNTFNFKQEYDSGSTVQEVELSAKKKKKSNPN